MTSFENLRGNYMMSRGDNRYTVPRTPVAERGAKRVNRLRRGEDARLEASYDTEKRFDEWLRYTDSLKERVRQNPNPDYLTDYNDIPFNSFTVEKRGRYADDPVTYAPIEKSVTYQPKQPVKEGVDGCKYGKYKAAGHIFCFRNPNHHKLPRGQADRSKIRTAEQINRVRNRNRAPAEEEDEGEAEPDRIRGRTGMRTNVTGGRTMQQRRIRDYAGEGPIRSPVVPRRSARLKR